MRKGVRDEVWLGLVGLKQQAKPLPLTGQHEAHLSLTQGSELVDEPDAGVELRIAGQSPLQPYRPLNTS
jgi:hypothetical protein